MKRIVFIISAIFVTTCMTAQTYIGGLYYNLDQTKLTAEVTSVPYGSLSGDVIIPAVVECNNQTYSVTSIGYNAFKGYTSLNSASLPSSIVSIGIGAFEGCRALEFIVCEAIVPPTLRTSTFYEVNKSIPVYVPNESIMSYKTSDGWKEFENIEGLYEEPTLIENNAIDSNRKKIIYEGQLFILRDNKTYTVQGQEVK